MRDFFKQNLLSILVCLFAMAAFASATTITRPYTSADYAAGAKAVGAKVNSEFDTIVNWLNGANISSGNIAVLGVNNANLAASGIKITASSSVFTSTSVSAVSITNLSTTITTVGRPVQVSLVPDYNSVHNPLSYVSGVGHPSASSGGEIFFMRDSSTLADFFIVGTASSLSFPCSAFFTIDNQVAGTYTYSVKMSSKDVVHTTSMTSCRLIVREIL